VLGDINLELAKKVSKKIGSDKITVKKLDASKTEDVEKAAKGADAVINLTLTVYDLNIMKAALISGAHYIDTSFGEPDLMDIRARDNILSQIIEKRPLSLDKEFKEISHEEKTVATAQGKALVEITPPPEAVALTIECSAQGAQASKTLEEWAVNFKEVIYFMQ
jgi:hypothetical protein